MRTVVIFIFVHTTHPENLYRNMSLRRSSIGCHLVVVMCGARHSSLTKSFIIIWLAKLKHQHLYNQTTRTYWHAMAIPWAAQVKPYQTKPNQPSYVKFDFANRQFFISIHSIYFHFTVAHLKLPLIPPVKFFCINFDDRFVLWHTDLKWHLKNFIRSIYFQ